MPMSKALPAMRRRNFVFGISAVAGGLVMGVMPAQAQADADIDYDCDYVPIGDTPHPEVTIWTLIEPDDSVIIRVARSEMGQGSFTALPMLVAEELDCRWSDVRADYVDSRENVIKGKPWGDMVTAASLGIRASQSYLRKAGAQARMMLIAEAAARWNVPVSACTAANSVVTHGSTGRTFRYGELAEGASRRPVPQEVTLKPPSQWSIIGTSQRRLDTPEKALGKPIYASDIRVPGMLFASFSACPAYGGRLKNFDAGQAMTMPGVRQVFSIEHGEPYPISGVAVLADSWWQARKAMQAVSIEWDMSPAQGLSTDSMRDSFINDLDASDATIGHKRIGDPHSVLASASSVLEVDYDVPFLCHATMEPMTCSAHVVDGKAELWAPTQNGEGTLRTIAKTLQLDVSAVTVHKLHLGGGFGRRGLAQDWAVAAALIARSAGVPIKMIWTREEDIQHDYYRPLVVSRNRAAFGPNGELLAWTVRLCGPSNLILLAPDRLFNGHDYEMLAAFNPEDFFYDVPNFEVGYVMRNTPVTIGFWRGVNHSQNGFFRESFVDEMAHKTGQDPYQFRRKLYAKTPRSLAVLDAVAKLAGWGSAPPGIFQGIAIVECYNAVSAQVVDISVSESGDVTIHRVSCAIDAVQIVNPSIVEAQMQGAVIFALSAALKGEITIEDGCVQQSNFSDQPILRMNQVPEIKVAIVSSGDKYSKAWGGVGEPGTPPLFGALCNAIFAATGQRIRSLPIAKHFSGQIQVASL